MTALQFPRFGDERGLLAFLEGGRHVPFPIGAVNVWSGRTAMGAGPRATADVDRVVFAIAGSVTLRLSGVTGTSEVRLDQPDRAQLIAAGTKLELIGASPDAVLVFVLAESAATTGNVRRAGEESSALATVDDAEIVQLGAAGDAQGSISVHGRADVPFDIARLYYLYDVPAGRARGAHAHRELQQLILAAAGSFEVHLSDGRSERTVRLDRPDQGLLMPRMLWRDLDHFSTGAACLVLASRPYEEADYIREHDEFVAERERLATVR